MNTQVELGCGLIGIGREWGAQKTQIPDEKSAIAFLEFAFSEGIRFFDTAPSYGWSEERVGKFLSELNDNDLAQLTITTKFGDHWDFEKQDAYVDHSFDALKASLDHSLKHLGKIDILQLHKTRPEVLQSDDLARAWEYAKSCGIQKFGASVSDLESARIVCEDPFYTFIQLPFHRDNLTFEEIIQQARDNEKQLIINRPFNMGAMVLNASPTSEESVLSKAFRFIIERIEKGIVLTGTKSIDHLRENISAFRAALT